MLPFHLRMRRYSCQRCRIFRWYFLTFQSWHYCGKYCPIAEPSKNVLKHFLLIFFFPPSLYNLHWFGSLLKTNVMPILHRFEFLRFFFEGCCFFSDISTEPLTWSVLSTEPWWSLLVLPTSPPSCELSWYSVLVPQAGRRSGIRYSNVLIIWQTWDLSIILHRQSFRPKILHL